uniref:Uncharacterized protein n=1 Tax=Myripristis murdjan TaxID=586833 RepID=A0A667WZ78_9TELE
MRGTLSVIGAGPQSLNQGVCMAECQPTCETQSKGDSTPFWISIAPCCSGNWGTLSLSYNLLTISFLLFRPPLIHQMEHPEKGNSFLGSAFHHSAFTHLLDRAGGICNKLRTKLDKKTQSWPTCSSRLLLWFFSLVTAHPGGNDCSSVMTLQKPAKPPDMTAAVWERGLSRGRMK